MNINTVITVSAPGKIHLMGEHAVVYGNTALLAAINKRLRVKLIANNTGNIRITSGILNKTGLYTHEKLAALTKKMEEQWLQFKKNHDSTLLSTTQELDYPAIAIGQTLKFFHKQLTGGFDLSIDSDIPVGSGLGSSAAVAVSVAAAVQLFLTRSLNKKTVNKIAYSVEQMKHGTSSGGDNTVCCVGGIVFFQKKQAQIQRTVPVLPLFLVDSGRPVESTGEMVEYVHDFRQKNKQDFSYFLKDQEAITNEFLSYLNARRKTVLVDLIKKSEKNLERIGVVSERARHVISLVEKNGGGAKISGAGGRKKGSGILVVYHPDGSVIEHAFMKNNIPYTPVTLGSEGIITHT